MYFMCRATTTCGVWPRATWHVVRARLDRDRDSLLVFFVCIILFRVAAAVNSFTDLLVAAAPVVMLASGITIASVTSNTSRRVVGQWGGAGGACCEDHFGLGAVISVVSEERDFFWPELFLIPYFWYSGT